MHRLAHAQRNKQHLCQERLHCIQQRILLLFNSVNLNDFKPQEAVFKTELRYGIGHERK